jgi:hypothetical protein
MKHRPYELTLLIRNIYIFGYSSIVKIYAELDPTQLKGKYGKRGCQHITVAATNSPNIQVNIV